MSTTRFITKTIAVLSFSTILSVNAAFAAPPQIQMQPYIGTLAGTGSFGDTTGPRLSAQFGLPSHIAIRPDGDLLVTDYGNSKLKLVENSFTGQVFNYDSLTPYYNPEGIVYDPFGYAWVADRYNRSIRRIDEANTTTILAAGQGTSTPSLNDPGAVDGAGNVATFNSTFSIESDADGQIYAAIFWGVENVQDGAHVIRLLSYDSSNVPALASLTSADITVSTVAGIAGLAGNTDGGVGTSELNNPLALAFKKDYSLLYFTDYNGYIKTLDPLTNIVSTLIARPLGSDVIDIVVGSDDALYLSDWNASVIWRYDGEYSIYAGVPNSFGFVDGPALEAQFNHPYGMAIDENDNLYIVDEGNYAIRALVQAPSFSEFIDSGDCRLSQAGTILNDMIAQIIIDGDFFMTDGIFDNPTLAALQALSLEDPETQAQFLDTLGPVHFPGMLVATEFTNNKIFNIQNLRAKSIYRRATAPSRSSASSNGGTSAWYADSSGGVWMEPIIGYLNRKEECCNTNLQSHINGITGGIDYVFGKQAVLGLSFGKIIDRIRYDYRKHREEIDSAFLAPYASFLFNSNRAQIDIGGIVATNLNKVFRKTGDGTTADGKDRGYAMAAKAYASYKILENSWFQLTPYAGAEYTNLRHGDYLETPEDPFSLNIPRHTSEMLREEAGVHINLRRKTLNLNTKLGYVHKGQFKRGKVIGEFGNGGSFRMEFKECDRHAGIVGVNLEYEVAPNALVTANYEGEFSNRSYGQTYAGSIGARFKF